MHTTRIEQQLTILLRRVQRIHVTTASGEVELERSAYGILCRLADEGPHRLGSLAQAFGLDPSTITRQVQALEQAGWAGRHADPTDRRAAILDITDDGRQVLQATRERRRESLRAALSDWPEEEQSEFGRLLEKFNASLDDLVQRRSEARSPGDVAE
jgi:DNA-binding MarR family transcriptional regulator